MTYTNKFTNNATDTEFARYTVSQSKLCEIIFRSLLYF